MFIVAVNMDSREGKSQCLENHCLRGLGLHIANNIISYYYTVLTFGWAGTSCTVPFCAWQKGLYDVGQ
jgi:hypothetical protein